MKNELIALDVLKEWVKSWIEVYESMPDMFKAADSIPSVAYELGRHDSLIEIKDLLNRYGNND